MAETPCAVCGAPGMEPFYEAASVPTNSCILLPSAPEARAYPRGDLRLAACPACGFIANVAFDPGRTEYSGRYEETQGFSPRFNAFHQALARTLVDDHGIRDADVLEIGCGKGEFLALLAELGENRCLGLDPGVDPTRLAEPARGRVEVRAEFFTEDHGHLAADLVVCKMTLEHIPEPRPFLGAVRRVASNRPGTLVFFQVPDVTRILADCAFEDVYYEHCAYYGPTSLAHLFRRAGFVVRAVESVFGGQYLTLIASLDRDGGPEAYAAPGEAARHRAAIREFGPRVERARARWQERLTSWSAEGRRVVLWGSGSKAVAFLTTLDAPAVRHVVDINPNRHGHFMPGTGQPIVGPDALVELEPDVVVVMNRIYVEEIRSDLGRRGLDPEVVAL